MSEEFWLGMLMGGVLVALQAWHMHLQFKAGIAEALAELRDEFDLVPRTELRMDSTRITE